MKNNDDEQDEFIEMKIKHAAFLRAIRRAFFYARAPPI